MVNHNELVPNKITQSSIAFILSLCSTVYHIWLQRNASIHQGRLLSEEAMVKMIGWEWEVKNRAECSSYCNSVQNRGIDTNNVGVFTLLCLWCRLFLYWCCILWWCFGHIVHLFLLKWIAHSSQKTKSFFFQIRLSLFISCLINLYFS